MVELDVLELEPDEVVDPVVVELPVNIVVLSNDALIVVVGSKVVVRHGQIAGVTVLSICGSAHLFSLINSLNPWMIFLLSLS